MWWTAAPCGVGSSHLQQRLQLAHIRCNVLLAASSGGSRASCNMDELLRAG